MQRAIRGTSFDAGEEEEKEAPAQFLRPAQSSTLQIILQNSKHRKLQDTVRNER